MKKKLKKKILPFYFCRYDIQNGVRKFFFKEMGLEIFKFKLFFTIKLLINFDRQKIKKIPHTILETVTSQIISQNFVKKELNAEELELLEYALVIVSLV